MGRWNDVVVFVPLTVPGDVVDVQIRSKRRRFIGGGLVVRYVRKSPLRAEAFCAHFGVCGGCKWQNLPYEEQLRFKTEQVRDQLTRIGKIALPQIAPCLGVGADPVLPQQARIHLRRPPLADARRGGERDGLRCRARARIPFSQHVRQGAGHRQVLAPARSVERHPHRDQTLLHRKRLHVPQRPRTQGADAQHDRPHGFDGRGDGDRGVRRGRPGADRRAAVDHLAANFPQITSLFYIVTKFNDSVGDLDPVCYKGKDHIVEEMEGLRFKVGPKSFYQTNSAQAYELYKVAREFADLKPEDVLYDLYTGTGTIANFCAARCSPGGGRGVCARSDRRCEGQFADQRHREYGFLCGRHEAGAERRVRRHQRPSRRDHPRSAACGRGRAGDRGDPARRAPADRLQLRSRHAGPRLGAARRRLPRRGGTARGHVPPRTMWKTS